ncbi:MAG: acetyl-CoA carboxylase carboxyltransferase subunit alpha [Lachnospiraceae bacterium]|nr:acetyl-CoA carboxylase carboxyltransferase subunit alpha [Lachnospiraceae bacterium]
MKAYDSVLMARAKDRPRVGDYIDAIFTDFFELRGDHLMGEDPAIYGGIALFDGRPVTVLGHRKGRELKENLACHFGMPEPEGYRKALRLMKEAEKFGRPVITFIDTPGAYPGKEAEEHGISDAIAENLAEMSTLRVPIISVVTGEGSSGGALAIGVADRMYMLEHAVYSVLSPEGFASILWKDSSLAPRAAEVMHMTAPELYCEGLADRLIPESPAGIEKDFTVTTNAIAEAIRDDLKELMALPADELVDARYEKYRHFEGKMAPATPEEGEA